MFHDTQPCVLEEADGFCCWCCKGFLASLSTIFRSEFTQISLGVLLPPKLFSHSCIPLLAAHVFGRPQEAPRLGRDVVKLHSSDTRAAQLPACEKAAILAFVGHRFL